MNEFKELNSKELEIRIQEEAAKVCKKEHLLIMQSKKAAIGDLIASIGYQWRQPLNSLTLLIQDIREALEFGEINDQYIEQFSNESMLLIKQMSQTIHDFRKFFEPDKQKTSFSVGEAIEEVLSIFSSNLKKYGIQVEFTYGGLYMAYGYKKEFCQAVLNVLANARDAFIQGRILHPIIHIQLNESVEWVKAELQDNAGGIKTTPICKVFDPFLSTKPQGIGLGLYMAKMFLENMNGLISIENKHDGTCIYLSIPKRIDIHKQDNTTAFV